LLIAGRETRLFADVRAQNAEAQTKARAPLIEQMKFTISKLRDARAESQYRKSMSQASPK
jgi:hypothetical protein